MPKKKLKSSLTSLVLVIKPSDITILNIYKKLQKTKPHSPLDIVNQASLRPWRGWGKGDASILRNIRLSISTYKYSCFPL